MPFQVAASILRGEGFTYTLPNRSKGNQLYVPGVRWPSKQWLSVAPQGPMSWFATSKASCKCCCLLYRGARCMSHPCFLQLPVLTQLPPHPTPPSLSPACPLPSRAGPHRAQRLNEPPRLCQHSHVPQGGRAAGALPPAHGGKGRKRSGGVVARRPPALTQQLLVIKAAVAVDITAQAWSHSSLHLQAVITTRILQLVHELCRKRIHVTKRDLFYTGGRQLGCATAGQCRQDARAVASMVQA